MPPHVLPMHLRCTVIIIIWPWLVGVETTGAMTDLLRICHPDALFTGWRRYRGTLWYIDRIYASKDFLLSLKSPSGKVCDRSGVPGAQDDDLVVVTLLN